MGDRTVIEKFHKKNEKRLFREKLIVLFWDFFLMFFFSFFFFITLYVLSCFLLCIWIGHFPMHSTRSWLREIVSTMNKKSMKMAFILQRRPEVFGTCPLFFKNRYGLLSAAKSYGRQRIRKSGQKWKGPSPFVLIEWWFFFFYQFHSFHQTWISFERFSYALKPSAIICFICFGQAWLLSH